MVCAGDRRQRSDAVRSAACGDDRSLVSLTAPGRTTLTYAATDVAGNEEAQKSLSVVVGRGDDDGVRFACAAPTPSFALPAHGTLLLAGTITTNGQTVPFSKTVTI